MTIGLLGKKLGMTREFVKGGQSVPVTVIKIEKGWVLDVFTKDNIETYISYKRENEVSPMDLRPHPHEFNLYYDV